MVLSIVIMLIGLYCLLVASRYYPIIGYRGALYYMKKQNYESNFWFLPIHCGFDLLY